MGWVKFAFSASSTWVSLRACRSRSRFAAQILRSAGIGFPSGASGVSLVRRVKNDLFGGAGAF